jgi:hypothetical protein
LDTLLGKISSHGEELLGYPASASSAAQTRHIHADCAIGDDRRVFPAFAVADRQFSAFLLSAGAVLVQAQDSA